MFLWHVIKAGLSLLHDRLSQAYLFLLFVKKSNCNKSKVQHNLNWCQLRFVWSYIQTDERNIIIVILNLLCINKYYLSVYLYTSSSTTDQLSPATSTHLVQYMIINIVFHYSSWSLILSVLKKREEKRSKFETDSLHRLSWLKPMNIY